MPKQDPAAWREVREMWETSEMTFVDVAARLDVAVPTVSIRAKRECWVKADVVSLDRVTYSPKQLVEIAVRSLVRAASQTKDFATSVKAASLLLERTMGRVVIEAKPMLLPDGEIDPNDWPDWMKARRLAYQMGLAQGDQSEPEAAISPEGSLPYVPPAPEAPKSAPGADSKLAVAADLPEPSRKLRVVQQPQFWDSPTSPSNAT